MRRIPIPKSQFVIAYMAEDEFSSVEVVECVEYHSAPALRAAFRRFIADAHKRRLPPWQAKFCGIEFLSDHFFAERDFGGGRVEVSYVPPTIKPLDRWFRSKVAGNTANA